MSWYNIAKKYIKEKNIKQYQLLDVFEVDTRGAIGHYLTGRRDPSIWQLKRFSIFSGLSMDYLLADPEPEYPPVVTSNKPCDVDDLLLLQSISRLTRSQKQMLAAKAQEMAAQNDEIRQELGGIGAGKVPCTFKAARLEDREGQKVDGLVATCGRCGHQAESFGHGEEAVMRCLVLMRQNCPRQERNLYVSG